MLAVAPLSLTPTRVENAACFMMCRGGCCPLGSAAGGGRFPSAAPLGNWPRGCRHRGGGGGQAGAGAQQPCRSAAEAGRLVGHSSCLAGERGEGCRPLAGRGSESAGCSGQADGWAVSLWLEKVGSCRCGAWHGLHPGEPERQWLLGTYLELAKSKPWLTKRLCTAQVVTGFRETALWIDS